MFFDYVSMPLYGIIAGIIGSISLGPIGVLCIQRTLNTSRRAGFVSGLGAATADTSFAALAVFALAWVTGFIDKYEIWVEVVGGILIVFLGLTIFLKKINRPKKVVSKGNYVSNYFSVLFLALPNPAYFFFFVLIFAGMGISGMELVVSQKWLIVLGVFGGAACWWFFLTWIVNKLRKRFTLHSMWWINKISGGIIAIFGAYLILAVIYKLISTIIETGKFVI